MKKKLIIMAGGNGTRFWPFSRKGSPKQVLNISGKDCMINESCEKLSGTFREEDTFIVTVESQADCIKNVLNSEKIVILKEPEPRGTAACLLMSALKLYKDCGDCVICAMPADSSIKDGTGFNQVIQKALQEALRGDRIITIGIRPDFPATGYGYIKAAGSGNGLAKVSSFVEKPAAELAQRYYDAGNYYWNAGIFVFTAKQMIDSFKRLCPEIYGLLMSWEAFIGTPEEDKALAEIYKSLKSTSIDYAIMEKADNLYVIPADIGWHDIGTWEVLEHLHEKDTQGNSVKGDCVCIDTKNCSIISDKLLVAAVGLEDLIVVEKDGVVLICRKDKAQDVKKVVEELKKSGKEEYV